LDQLKNAKVRADFLLVSSGQLTITPPQYKKQPRIASRMTYSASGLSDSIHDKSSGSRGRALIALVRTFSSQDLFAGLAALLSTDTLPPDKMRLVCVMVEQRFRWSAVALTGVMTTLYAWFDFVAPGEINVAIFYASSVAVAGFSRSRWFLWLTTAICIALTYAGLLLGPQPTAPVLWALAINRSFVALGLIMIAAIVQQRMQMLGRIEDARRQQARQNQVLRETDDKLRDINAELERRVNREVERRLQAEQSLYQAQKMEAIGQLTGGLAHDFNNILTMIVGNLDLLEPRLSTEGSGRRLVQNARRGAEQGTDLVKHLLSFARRQQLEPEVIDVGAALADVIALARPVVTTAIELSLELGTHVWQCCADKAQLQSALLNLVINARDALPNGGRIIISAENETLTTEAMELGAGDYVLLSVQDTGTGMSPEVLARVFEPFFTTKSTGKGSGLGLAMVYGFAKQSGGTVRIESIAGRGTTVRLYLPRPIVSTTSGTPSERSIIVPERSSMSLQMEGEDTAREPPREPARPRLPALSRRAARRRDADQQEQRDDLGDEGVASAANPLLREGLGRLE
jgi:signal transduction histidine kinase